MVTSPQRSGTAVLLARIGNRFRTSEETPLLRSTAGGEERVAFAASKVRCRPTRTLYCFFGFLFGCHVGGLWGRIATKASLWRA